MPYSVKGFFEISEDMVQILLMLEVLFTQDSKVEDLFCGASSGSEASLFFSNYFFSRVDAKTFGLASMIHLSHLSFVQCEQVKFRPKKKVKIKVSHSVVAVVVVCVWGGGGGGR